MAKTSGTEARKLELTGILDQFEKAGLNTVFLQVRTGCDALYASGLEPWSQRLTGTQGRAPSPLWDPLEFAVAEAHRRGMELPAWLNPYRAQTYTACAMAPSHVTALHPDWILDFPADGMKLLDPGHPDVPDYVVAVVRDIPGRYDVDGIHFDDYFYPYSGIRAGRRPLHAVPCQVRHQPFRHLEERGSRGSPGSQPSMTSMPTPGPGSRPGPSITSRPSCIGDSGAARITAS